CTTISAWCLADLQRTFVPKRVDTLSFGRWTLVAEVYGRDGFGGHGGHGRAVQVHGRGRLGSGSRPPAPWPPSRDRARTRSPRPTKFRLSNFLAGLTPLDRPRRVLTRN